MSPQSHAILVLVTPPHVRMLRVLFAKEFFHGQASFVRIARLSQVCDSALLLWFLSEQGKLVTNPDVHQVMGVLRINHDCSEAGFHVGILLV